MPSLRRGAIFARFDSNIDWKAFQRGSKQAIGEAMLKCAEYAKADAQKRVQKRSGDLSRNIIARNISEEGFQLAANRAYAVYLELGTRPHVIVPVKKKALHWEVRVGKRGKKLDVFAQKVHHPGTDPFPFLYPAIYENRDTFIELLRRELMKLGK
jgi:hypothetical protein